MNGALRGPCRACGHNHPVMATSSRGGTVHYWCHADDHSCYNDYRGSYFVTDEELAAIMERRNKLLRSAADRRNTIDPEIRNMLADCLEDIGKLVQNIKEPF